MTRNRIMSLERKVKNIMGMYLHVGNAGFQSV